MNTSYVDTSYGYNAASASGLVGGVLIFTALIGIISIALSIFMFVSMWKLFKKLGKPGWAGIIPIYNMYVLCCEVGQKPIWYLLLFFIPIANIYAGFVIYDAVAKKFGKDTIYTIGMLFLPFIFIPMLAFGKNNVVYDEQQSMETQTQDNNFSQSNAMIDQSANMVQQPVNDVMQNNVSTDNTMMQNDFNVQMNGQANMMQQPVNDVMQNNVSTDNTMMQNDFNAQMNGPANMMQQPVNDVMQNNVSTDNTMMQNDFNAQMNGPANMMQQPVNDVMQNNVSTDNTMMQNDFNAQMNGSANMMQQPVNDVMQNNVSTDNQMVDQSDNTAAGVQEHTSLWSNNQNNN